MVTRCRSTAVRWAWVGLGLVVLDACLQVPRAEDDDTDSATDASDGTTDGTSTMSSADATTASSATTTLDSTGDAGSDASTSGGSGEFVFTDDDLDGEFGAGVFVGCDWSGEAVQLSADEPQGVFTSRIFDATESVRWDSITWSPVGPYGKPLPDGGVVETGYVDPPPSDEGLMLLLHLDGDRVGLGDALPDDSGRGNDAQVLGFESPITTEGRFQGAVRFSTANYASIPTPPGGDLQFGEDDFTWSMWIRTTSACSGATTASNQVYMGIEDPDAPDNAHMWLGCLRPETSECPSPAGGGGRAGGLFSTRLSASEESAVCGTTDIVDGQWHHIALVKQDHPAATLTLWVDGQIEDQASPELVADYTFDDNPDFGIGAFSAGAFQASTTLDEVAIWRRALSPDEVLAVYRRGAVRLVVGVRVCEDPGCSDGSAFTGGLIDPPDAVSPGSVLPLPADLLGRYFQYRVELFGDPALSLSGRPEFTSVTVTASP
jgi:hypothetical protein